MTLLDPNEQPQLWFFQTVSETNKDGVPRARLLPNQLVPVDDSGNFEPGDENANVNSSHSKRKDNPIGTIFACKQIFKNRGGRKLSGEVYYRVPDSAIIVVNGPFADAPEEVQIAYENFIKTGKVARLKIVKASKKTSTPKAKSVVDKLIKDYPCPTPEDSGYYVDPVQWQRLIFNFYHKRNTLLIGPSGTGKTELGVLLGKTFGITPDIFDMAAKIDPIASLIGVHRHSATKKGSYFDRAAFTYSIEKPGFVILDEISRAGAVTNNIFFPVLDSRRELSMDIATGDEKRTIKVHDDCRFLATANVGAEYTGTSTLDPALKERFKIVKTNYLPEADEVRVLNLRTDLNKKDSETIVAVANELRTLYKSGDLSTGISLRHTIDAAEMTFGGFSLDVALEFAFLPAFQDEEEMKVLDVLMAR